MRCVGISEKWEGNNEDPTSKRLLKGKGDKEQGVEKRRRRGKYGWGNAGILGKLSEG